MNAVARVLTGLVALSHVGILVLEMFFWDHPVGRRIFGMTPAVSASSAVLAANQGLYNGFLAAGLGWQVDQFVPPPDRATTLFTIWIGTNDVHGGEADIPASIGNVRRALDGLAQHRFPDR